MSRTNENAINALASILKHLSNCENLCIDNLLNEYEVFLEKSCDFYP